MPSRLNVIALSLLLSSSFTAHEALAARFHGSVNFPMSGAQEFPSNTSSATGHGFVTIDTDSNKVRYNIFVVGLTGPETGAHIHGFAAPGANAGVLTALPSGNHKVGVWTYTEPQEANILAGLTYVNVHSSPFPGGEIRGQIVPVVIPTKVVGTIVGTVNGVNVNMPIVPDITRTGGERCQRDGLPVGKGACSAPFPTAGGHSCASF